MPHPTDSFKDRTSADTLSNLERGTLYSPPSSLTSSSVSRRSRIAPGTFSAISSSADGVHSTVASAKAMSISRARCIAAVRPVSAHERAAQELLVIGEAEEKPALWILLAFLFRCIVFGLVLHVSFLEIGSTVADAEPTLENQRRLQRRSRPHLERGQLACQDIKAAAVPPDSPDRPVGFSYQLHTS